MKPSIVIASVVLAVSLASASFALEPMWELDVDFSHPQMVTINSPTGDRTYWCVVYSFTNSSEQPRAAQPRITLSSDTGKSCEDTYLPAVFDVINKKNGGTLLSVTKTALELKPGDSRRAVAIFDKPDSETALLTLLAYGLSGKRVEMRGEQEGVLARAYKIQWSILGDRFYFTPSRLKKESSGFVSVFRTKDGTTTEEPIVIVPIEEEVKAARQQAAQPVEPKEAPAKASVSEGEEESGGAGEAVEEESTEEAPAEEKTEEAPAE